MGVEKMKIYSIIVTYNGIKWLDRCFSSLRASIVPVNVIVIDNGSTDNTVNYLREHYPEVILKEYNENLGFAKANNIGIRLALDCGADYVFLLNQDAWIEKNTISELLRSFEEQSNVGIVAPVQLNGSGSGLDEGFTHYMPSEFISDAYMQKLRDCYVVPFVNAAAWLISVECIKRVGGFDTSLFFHYGEDDNYCQRVQYHQYKIVLNTHCSFCHDREFRKGNEKNYREKIMRLSPFHKENLLYGNINLDFEMRSISRAQWKSLIVSFLFLAQDKIKKHLALLRHLKRIQSSRDANIKGGLVWL